jgi:hypothetical protein
MRISHVRNAFLALLMLLGASTSLHAVTLADLLAGGSITVGDKTFSDFTFSFTCTGDQLCDPTDPAGINVTGVIENGLIGLRFSGGISAAGNTTFDLLIGYTATVNDPNFLINDVHLAFNAETTGTGVFSTVTETVKDPNNGNLVIGQTSVTNPPEVFSTTIDLAYPVSEIDVLKDVLLNTQFCTIQSGNPVTCRIDISFIDQFLSQTTTTVPEPSTMLLFGIGLTGLGFWGRKRLN